MYQSPRVSIILPTYNRIHCVRRSISSVLVQSYRDFELIIWDDGSTDGTDKWLQEYDDSRIRYFYAENHGVSYARNRAIEQSLGDVIAFIDSDDEWLPNKLELQISLLDDHQVDFISGNYLNVDEQTGEIETVNNFGPSGAIPSGILLNGSQIDALFLRNQSSITIPSVVCKKDLFQKFGRFNEGLRNAEDKEIYWRFILADVKFLFSEQVLYNRYKLYQSLENYSLDYRENQIKSLDVMYQDALNYKRFEFDKMFSKRLKFILKHYLNQCHMEKKHIMFSVKSIIKNYKILRKFPFILAESLVSYCKQSFARSLSSKRRS